MTRTLRLNVLGRFEAQWSDGEPVDLTTKKAQALLAYLAVERGHPHTREHLATLLWADTGDERARHNLRQALSKIRVACTCVVDATGDCLTIDANECTVDVAEFERLAKSDDPDDLRRALDLYRGDLLEGLTPREFAYEEWLLLARNRLRKMACQTASRLAEILRKQDQAEESIEALNDLLAIDPAHESAHRDLMVLLADVGRRSDALRQYQACVEALERELSAEPSAEIRQLYTSLRKSASEPGAARESVSPAAPARTDHPTIAVLPFENLSGEEDAYFVDGIVEDLITALSSFHSLFVIARGSSFAYRDRDMTDQAIARELGAQFLLRGSVQRAANRVRINVQLLDALAGLNVWGHRFDREMEDVFLLQDEITSTLVSTLAGRVEAARLAHARKAPTERLDAYDCLLRGKDYHHRYTAEDCAKCVKMFERAIDRDPSYAVAYAWLACGLGQAMVFGLGDVPMLVDQCEAACERGLELDENESECHRVLAQVNLERGNLKQSIWHQERALFLNPNDDRSVCAMGEILSFVGRHEEGEEWVRKSMRLNPYHPPRYWTHLGRALFHQARYDEALVAFDNVGRARKDDLAYRVAVNVRLGNEAGAAGAVAELGNRYPNFDATAFVGGLPFERREDRDALLEPLAEGLVDQKKIDPKSNV